MKNSFLKKTVNLGLVVILVFSSFVFASAETVINLTTVYGSTLADIVLPEGCIWDTEDPAKVSVGDAGDKSFPAKILGDNGEYENVAVEVTVEPTYISEVYASTNSSHYYTGNPVVPEIKAYFNGKELVENKDYKLVCSDNINVGTAKITVEGIGNFKGKTSFYFSIIKKDVEGVYLNLTEAELVAGKTLELTAEVIADDATFKGVTWFSSDSSVAAVDESGVVIAIREGVATITATTNDGGYTAECVINVVVHDEESDHKYNYVSGTDPGCETEGRVIYKCTVCDHEKTETVSAVGHTPGRWETVLEPTESTMGKMVKKCIFCGVTLEEESIPFDIKIWVKTPSKTIINYGDSIILHAESDKALPKGYSYSWICSDGKFTVEPKGDTCKISAVDNGKSTITLILSNENGNPVITYEQTMTAKAGFFQKIFAFFKEIFGLSKTYLNFTN